MGYMTWTKHFVTGIPLVDAQHHALVELVNQVAPILSGVTPPDPAQTRALIARLFDYAAVHFRDEERFMTRSGLSSRAIEDHHELHIAFVADVQALQRELEEGTLDGATLLRFLTSWLTFHILGADQAMARQARLVADGVDPERARELSHEADEADSAHAALQGSLLELFALTQERSAALALSNRQLRAARRELENLNAELEARVEERTHALSESNHALEREKDHLARALEDLKHTQLALIQSEKLRAVGQLAAGLAHELNTPLQVIGDAVALLSEGHEALKNANAELAAHVEDRTRDAIAQDRELAYFEEVLPAASQRARTAIARAAELVHSILSFSRPTGTKPRPAALDGILKDTIEIAHGQLDGLEVALELADLPAIHCHPTELSHALLALLLNGRDAIREARRLDPGRGRLAIRAYPEADQVHIEVADDGTGIADEVAPRVFEPFFTTRPVGEGTGQGLSTARAIVVERHGGTLDFVTRPGSGTTFRVRLPIGAPRAVLSAR